MKTENLADHLPSTIYAQLPMCVDKFKINTNERMAHFLGQCSHESNGFARFEENLNYSAKGLMATFGAYFPDELTAKSYEHKPEAIASKVYANRMGNGDEKSGDGYKFRGRGAIQLTGHNNYQALGEALLLDLIKNPSLVSSGYTVSSAAWFFDRNNLNYIADAGVNDPAIIKMTKRINGGVIGLAERIAKTNEFYRLLTT